MTQSHAVGRKFDVHKEWLRPIHLEVAHRIDLGQAWAREFRTDVQKTAHPTAWAREIRTGQDRSVCFRRMVEAVELKDLLLALTLQIGLNVLCLPSSRIRSHWHKAFYHRFANLQPLFGPVNRDSVISLSLTGRMVRLLRVIVNSAFQGLISLSEPFRMWWISSRRIQPFGKKRRPGMQWKHFLPSSLA